MKTMCISKVSCDDKVLEAQQIPALLNASAVVFQPICCVNWKDYPYCPDVKFRIAHTGRSLLLEYRVKEASVRAVAASDNGRVWEDSCCEFFFQVPGDKENYYNLECNCGGTLLIGYGRKGEREHAPVEVTSAVKRWSSLGKAPFEERMGECEWQMALLIPADAFFCHQIEHFVGMTARANFYKCGDLLATPHFLSWNPINLPEPCFHCPEFFGSVHFE